MSPSARLRAWRCACSAALWIGSVAAVAAHDGPPFPIVSSRPAGPYVVSVWTDPDATEDGTAGGQFWVIIERPDGRARVPDGTRATVAVRPLDREAPPQTALAEPVRGNVSTQFAALVLDRESRFAVEIAVIGPLGTVTVDSEVDATYDLRPPPYMLVWYLAPFLLLGGLWVRLLRQRRRMADGRRVPARSGPTVA